MKATPKAVEGELDVPTDDGCRHQWDVERATYNLSHACTLPTGHSGDCVCLCLAVCERETAPIATLAS